MFLVPFRGIGTGAILVGRRGEASPYSAAVTGLTDNGTYGATAQIGVELTGTITGLEGGETVVHRWELIGTGIIAGADAATYTPIAGQDLALIRYNPTVDEAAVPSAAWRVRYAPPTVASAIADQTPTEGSTIDAIDLTAVFDGSDLTFVVESGAAVIDGTELQPATEDGAVVVSAENSGGKVEDGFDVAVQAPDAPEFLTQPSIAPVDLREGDTGTLALGSVDAGTLSIESLTDLTTSEAVGYDDGVDPAEFDATATTYRLTVRAQEGNATSFATVEKTAEPYGFRSDRTFIVDDGTVTFDYTGSAAYDENAAAVSTADLVAGPVNTIPPHVAGTMGNGNVFSVDVIGAWVGLDSDGETAETYVWSGAGTGTGSSVSIADDTLELVLTARGTNDADFREVVVTIPARAQFIELPGISPSTGDEGTSFVIDPGEGPASGSLTFAVTDDGADVTEDLTDNGNGTWTYAAPLGTVDRALVVTSTVDTGDGSPAEQTASATIYEAGTTPEWDVEVDASGNITVNERAAVQTRPLTFTVNQAGDINITGVG